MISILNNSHILIILILALSLRDTQSVTSVYEVVTVSKFNHDFQKSFGCGGYSEIVYGTYVYQTGFRDAATILNSPYQFQLNPQCGVSKKYYKVFGTAQDYQKLLKSNPGNVANTIRALSLPRSAKGNTELVIDWAYSLSRYSPSQEEVGKMWKWLIDFTNSLEKEALIKIDADLLCYHINGQPAVKSADIKRIAGWIVKTYGRGSSYLTYESLFSSSNYEAEPHYSSECPRNPSLATLQKVASIRSIYLAKTLHKEIKGFMGDISELAERAEKEGLKVEKIFYDMLPENVVAY